MPFKKRKICRDWEEIEEEIEEVIPVAEEGKVVAAKEFKMEEEAVLEELPIREKLVPTKRSWRNILDDLGDLPPSDPIDPPFDLELEYGDAAEEIANHWLVCVCLSVCGHVCACVCVSNSNNVSGHHSELFTTPVRKPNITKLDCRAEIWIYQKYQAYSQLFSICKTQLSSSMQVWESC